MPKKTEALPQAVTGGVDVEVGGEKYTLIVTNRVIMQIEDEEGINLTTNPKDNLAMPSTRTLATVFHSLLKRAGADISFDRVVDLVGGGNRLPIQVAILSAWGNSMQTEEQVKILDPTLAEAVANAQRTKKK